MRFRYVISGSLVGLILRSRILYPLPPIRTMPALYDVGFLFCARRGATAARMVLDLFR